MCHLVLSRNNFNPLLAQNGEEGLTIYKKRRSEISLILADVSMPVLDGIGMVKEIFDHDEHANIIMMTGFSVKNLVPEYLQKLCSVLPKPFTSKQLVAAVRKCLKYDEEKAALNA